MFQQSNRLHKNLSHFSTSPKFCGKFFVSARSYHVLSALKDKFRRNVATHVIMTWTYVLKCGTLLQLPSYVVPNIRHPSHNDK